MRQRGMVTVELALAMLGAAGVAVVISWVVTVLGLMIQCQDTAAEVARQEARGDTTAAERARSDRPRGAEVSLREVDGAITVVVVLLARPWAAWLPGVPLRVQAAVLAEEVGQ